MNVQIKRKWNEWVNVILFISVKKNKIPNRTMNDNDNFRYDGNFTKFVVCEMR